MAIPDINTIMCSNSRKSLAYWIREILYLYHQTRDLNWKQAAMLMEKEVKMLKLVAGKDLEEVDSLVEMVHTQTAGKGPTDYDFLSPMSVGTEFLVRNKVYSAWLLNEFTHGGKKSGSVLLCPTTTLQDPRTWIWVDPVQFCKVFELKGILEVPQEE